MGAFGIKFRNNSEREMELTIADFGSNMYFQKINPYFLRIAARMH